MKLPDLVAHADWSIAHRKRWAAIARLRPDGRYAVGRTFQAPEGPNLLAGWQQMAGPQGAVLAGFDFPIGFPRQYAARVGVSDFLTTLPRLGTGTWTDFFQVVERSNGIGLFRPFYPQRSGNTVQRDLVDALGLDSIDDLRRRCERARPSRRAACPLFWTLGAQQVGKAAIAGWQEVLIPALRDAGAIRVWPFHGSLEELVAPGRVVVVETYPAEAYSILGVSFRPRKGRPTGKRVKSDRQRNSRAIRAWARKARVSFDAECSSELDDGFGEASTGEDRFDALVGLLGMLEIVLGRRGPGVPDDDAVRRVEGWIFGQEA